MYNISFSAKCGVVFEISIRMRIVIRFFDNEVLYWPKLTVINGQNNLQY